MAGELQQDGQGCITVAKLAELLTQATGETVATEDVASDVAFGAPALPDGRIPMLPYFGWLYNQVVNGAS